MRQPVSVAALAATAVTAIVLIWIAWGIIADTAAMNLGANAPKAALRFNQNEPAALGRLIEDELVRQPGDRAKAKELAERLLRSSPLDYRPLFYLGFLADQAGDRPAAAALATAAAARTRRYLSIQVWLFERAMRQKNYAEALHYFDAIYRVNFLNTEVLQVFLPWLAAFTTEPTAFQALQDALVTDPPWRAWLLRTLTARLADETRIEQIYAMLKKSAHPPTTEETRSYVGRLLTSQRYEAAYDAWYGTLTPGQRPDGSYPYNRDFNLPLDGLPFNWVLQSGVGSDVQIAPLETGDALGLRVQFSGARVSFIGAAKQLMRLPPGAYRLTGSVRADELETTRGLWWRLFCAGAGGIELAHTDLVAKNMPWTAFSAGFRVPDTECDAQWLQLELPARTGSENRIEGQIWYRFLRIVPLREGG